MKQSKRAGLKNIAARAYVKSGTGILPVRFCGIGILPMLHGLEAHATVDRLLTHPQRAAVLESETRIASIISFSWARVSFEGIVIRTDRANNSSLLGHAPLR